VVAIPRLTRQDVRRSHSVFPAGLVNLLNRLERQHNVRHLVGLAVPDKLNLALVVEQQKTVFVRKRLVRFDETKDFALFRVEEFHGKGFLGRRRKR
jgi:hypothetical protein